MTSGLKQSNELSELDERELKLTAAVYARHGAARHLRETGRLPDVVGGPWSVIPMRLVIQERGLDPELTNDEQLIYDAIIRDGRRPGGAVRLVDLKWESLKKAIVPRHKTTVGNEARGRTAKQW
jgi:hypothetical protein